jgi:hypothetical protein
MACSTDVRIVTRVVANRQPSSVGSNAGRLRLIAPIYTEFAWAATSWGPRDSAGGHRDSRAHHAGDTIEDRNGLEVLTSAAVGVLLEQGRMRLDEEIQTYVPQFRRNRGP